MRYRIVKTSSTISKNYTISIHQYVSELFLFLWVYLMDDSVDPISISYPLIIIIIIKIKANTNILFLFIEKIKNINMDHKNINM